MRYTIETTENGVIETLEVDGTIYKKEWERKEKRILVCHQKDFWAQMQENGDDREELLERVNNIFDDFLMDSVDEMREYL